MKRRSKPAPRRNLKILTWNINSVRLRMPQLAQLAKELRPDIVCLQETKVEDGLFPHSDAAAIGFPHRLVRGTKGYNGVAILSKLPLTPLESRLWCGRADGRQAGARVEFAGAPIEIQNFYVPAGGDIPDPRENDKFAHKLAFLDEMTGWSKANKRKGARSILVGDLNVAPLESDVWSHKALLKVVSHTPVEVEKLARIMGAKPWVDAVRHFTPAPERLYTWWSYRARDWAASDRGRRLDHVWVTRDLVPQLKRAEVLRAVRGWERPSDHVPVCVTLAAP